MLRCKFSHAEEADPCNGNETKMYLETAIAEHHLLSPRSTDTHSPRRPTLRLFCLRRLRRAYPSPRCKNLGCIIRKRRGGGGGGGRRGGGGGNQIL